MTWPTIGKLDILDHKQAFSVRFSDHHLNTGPFDNPTQIYHLNTTLVGHPDGYCSANMLFECPGYVIIVLKVWPLVTSPSLKSKFKVF